MDIYVSIMDILFTAFRYTRLRDAFFRNSFVIKGPRDATAVDMICMIQKQPPGGVLRKRCSEGGLLVGSV